jgi:hypothetical protein
MIGVMEEWGGGNISPLWAAKLCSSTLLILRFEKSRATRTTDKQVWMTIQSGREPNYHLLVFSLGCAHGAEV